MTANADGSKHSELRYEAWGENRYTWGDTPTARRFTGQIEDGTIGLYFYNARYYDPALGRFVQADPLADKTNPQSWNAYFYCLNNPLRYTDPSGYLTDDQIREFVVSDLSQLADEILAILRALHFDDTLYWGQLDDIGFYLNRVGTAGLDETGHLRFFTQDESFTVFDLMSIQGVEGWALKRSDPSQMWGYSSGVFNEFFNPIVERPTERDYIVTAEDTYLNVLGVVAIDATVGTILGLAAEKALEAAGVGSTGGPWLAVASGVAGFTVSAAIALHQHFNDPPPGSASGDRVLTYNYANWKETIILRGDQIIEHTWESRP